MAKGNASMAIVSNLNEGLQIFLTWVCKFSVIGSPFPSSKMLANLMVSRLPQTDIRVLELGVGTGVVTQALIRQGVKEEDLILVEINRIFAAYLRRSFPGAIVVECDARQLSSRIGVRGLRPDVVVSSLPLLCFSPAERRLILHNVFKILGRSGRCYQFTYGFRFPIRRSTLDELGLSCRYVGTVWLNFPPARVYEIVVSD